MENITKTLIIAAGILVTILIISLGMYIYNVSNSVDIEDATIQIETLAHNKQYELYAGIRTGDDVKILLNMASNKNKDLYKDSKNITNCICIRSNIPSIINEFASDNDMRSGLNGTRSYGIRYPSNIRKISKCISSSQKYKIWFRYNDAGLIWEINIDEPE